jgi:hypothetical protein
MLTASKQNISLSSKAFCAPDFTNGMADLICIFVPHPMGKGFIPTL